MFRQVAERRQTNGNGAAPRVEAARESFPEETHRQQAQPERAPAEEQQPENEAPTQEHEIPAMRERYPDWDETMTAARSVNIPPSAAQVLHTELPKEVKGHVVYILAKHPEFREELDRMGDQQAAETIRKLGSDVNAYENGTRPLVDRVKASLSKEELAATMRAVKDNPLAANIVLSLAKKINLLPNAPEVFKALAGDRETCERLAQMNQERAEMEITRLSGRLEAGNGKYVAPVSKAPAPIRPLGGGALRPSVDPADPELPCQEYKKLRERQEREDREARYGRR